MHDYLFGSVARDEARFDSDVDLWLFSTLCDNFCLWNPEVLIGQNF
ncbi:nucleotidyltransferase domain-containing protein [Microcystis sp. M_OC_Ca_00000000_C217Col]